jgi:5-methylcytosine-specific restriction endonuclease McrA
MRRRVRERAGGRCEYCLMHEEDAFFPYEADHVIAEKHGGATTEENLAWTCSVCNRYKGSDLTSLDPRTGRLIALYNPRRQRWRRHFRLVAAYIEPLTASGRATERLLHLNDQHRLDERAELISIGRYPVT